MESVPVNLQTQSQIVGLTRLLGKIASLKKLRGYNEC